MDTVGHDINKIIHNNNYKMQIQNAEDILCNMSREVMSARDTGLFN